MPCHVINDPNLILQQKFLRFTGSVFVFQVVQSLFMNTVLWACVIRPFHDWYNPRKEILDNHRYCWWLAHKLIINQVQAVISIIMFVRALRGFRYSSRQTSIIPTGFVGSMQESNTNERCNGYGINRRSINILLLRSLIKKHLFETVVRNEISI